MRLSRLPDIMADAAHVIFTSDSKTTTDNNFIDDEVVASVYGPDMAKYKISDDVKEFELLADFLA